jgi:hypothetical protein
VVGLGAVGLPLPRLGEGQVTNALSSFTNRLV